jgi:hypothetical protein
MSEAKETRRTGGYVSPGSRYVLGGDCWFNLLRPSKGEVMKGRRVYADTNGDLYLAEGDYGFSPKADCWQVRPPGRHAGSIPKHEVTEHDDGTITVSPSILLYDVDVDGNSDNWHGYLEHGEWREI